MTDMLERLERLERLLGVGDGERDEERKRDRGAKGAGGTEARLPVFLERPEGGHREFSNWMKAQHRPGRTVVAVGVKSDRSSWNSSSRRDAGEKLKRADLGATAALCQALGSETRLALLNELTAGDRTTSELMEAVGIDRGQLYHHLRDLFVQGLVEQPERGRYAATSRGFIAFLVASTLTTAGDPADRARVLDVSDLEEQLRAGDG